jgi:signal transduction histidine kinase
VRRPPRLRATLSVKLAAVLLGVVTGALLIVYLVVVPRLEDRLVAAKVDQLQRAAPSLVTELRRSENPVDFQDTVSFAAANLNARVAVLERLDEQFLRTLADSSPVEAGDIAHDPFAAAAVETGFAHSGRLERDDHPFAEVALPLGGSLVVLVSAPLDDALATVRLVRRSVVVAGIVALLASAVAGYFAALGLTRRLRRLERAAEGMASGDFTVPVDARGGDEVAELARGFVSMRERLGQLDRVRREFIANASHELRTPLFSLGGFLELLSDEELDAATRREFLTETRAQVERLTRLATDLLDLSRLDAGQLHVEETEVDLAATARTVAEEFRAVAEAGGHDLQVAANGPIHALADEQRVIQIARVLVENAVRHTPAGTPLEIAAGEDDGRAVLAVRDEGPGIPEADQEHLFERFYRAGGGHASGSGLGLAIASELASKMGGGLTVFSRPGNTVFTLVLPPSDLSSRENDEYASKEVDAAFSRAADAADS